jgi:glycosyltransferase involved in cell wall biosynthesis
LKPSLSVLAPVHNWQASLESWVVELLDLLPELTPRFEVLIVDDASTDATAEVAHDLSRRYPQVDFIRQPGRLGTMAALRAGLARTSGDLVLLCDDGGLTSPSEIHKLWRPSATREAVLAWPSPRSPLGRIPKIPSHHGPFVRGPKPSFQLIRRNMLRDWQQAGGHEELVAYLVRKGYPLVEIEIRDRKPARDVAALADRMAAKITHSQTAVAPTHRSDSGEPKRPNFAAKVKSFALDE